MNRLKYTCGGLTPSGCVIYTGELPAFIPSDSVSCDANIDEILEKYGLTIDSILDGNNLKSLDPGCLVFNPLTVKVRELHQLEIDKICSIASDLAALASDFENLDIFSKTIEIDLDCMAADAAPCQGPANTYTLSAILNTFKNKICELAEAVANLQ